MSIQSFLKLVEIQTKAASIIPYIIGSLYALLRFHEFHPIHALLMLVSLLSFDMATTALNNYFDYKRAIVAEGYGYEVHNPMVSDKLSERTVLSVIIVLLLLASIAGVLLVINTNLIVLLVGGLSFLVGILYSFGPVAISRMPLGELFSGLFMGFVIIFVSAYIHVVPEQLVGLLYDQGLVHVYFNVKEIVLLFLVSIPAIAGIANIMLANNICDMDEDFKNKRYTLPIYIGKARALQVFQWVYVFAYLDLFVLLYLGVSPILLALPLLTTFVVYRNTQQFCANPSKAETFVLAVKNFVVLNISRIAVLGLEVLMEWL